MRTAGVWSNLYIRVVTNDRGAGSLVSRVNGADGAQSVTIGAGATGEMEDTTNSDSVSAGDEINNRLITGSGGTTFIHRVVSSNYQASSGDVMLWSAFGGNNITVNNVTRYFVLAGNSGGDSTTTQTEASNQYSSRCAGTWRHLQINVETNTRGVTCTMRSRVNGGNGGQSIAIGAGATGIFEDTSGTDAIVSGDEINYAITYGADGNNLRHSLLSSEFIPSASTAPMLTASGAAAAITVNASSTEYIQFGHPTTSTTEAHMSIEANVAQTLSYLSAYVMANTITATSTIRLRKNAGDAAPNISIGSGVTGYVEDASNSERYALGDEFDVRIVGGGSGTSIVLNNLAALQDTRAGLLLRMQGEGLFTSYGRVA